MKNLFAEISIKLIGKYSSTIIIFALPDSITEWLESRDKNRTFDDFVKFVQWKLKDYKLSYSDKRIKANMFALLIRIRKNYRL